MFLSKGCNWCNVCPEPHRMIDDDGRERIQIPILRGVQVQLTGSVRDSVADGENVIFDTPVNYASNNISYNTSTGVFSIKKAGNYYISWWINVDGAGEESSLLFSIVTNEGQVISASSMSPVTTMQLIGNALISTVAPATFSLINNSGDDVIFGDAVIKADLAVIEVN